MGSSLMTAAVNAVKQVSEHDDASVPHASPRLTNFLYRMHIILQKPHFHYPSSKIQVCLFHLVRRVHEDSIRWHKKD